MEILTIDTTKPTAIKEELKGKRLFLVDENDKCLIKPSVEFDFNNQTIQDAKEIKADLIYTVKEYKAYGLAAIQCGFNLSVFTMGYEDDYKIYFNPKVLNVSTETEIMYEGCLSFPNLMLNIVRPKIITAQYYNEYGKMYTETFGGLTARVFLHETEHTQGIIFTKKAKPIALKNGLKHREKSYKKYARQIMRG